jgi:hypothetical protein
MKKSCTKAFKRLFLCSVASSLLFATTAIAEDKDNKCSEYCAGTFSVSPLTLNIASLTKDYRHKAAKINGFPKDPYKGTFGTGLNRGDRIGIGYDLELGYFVINNLELFTTLTYVYERGNTQGVSSPVLQIPAFGLFQDITYDFKSRKDAAISLGGRYFINIQESHWKPFVSLRATVTSQGTTKAFLTQAPAFTVVPDVPLGNVVLQKRKTLWGGMFQTGADYRINECIALTFGIGLLYTQRPKLHYVPAPGTVPIAYQDHYNKWTVPVQFSIRFTF